MVAEDGMIPPEAANKTFVCKGADHLQVGNIVLGVSDILTAI